MDFERVLNGIARYLEKRSIQKHEWFPGVRCQTIYNENVEQ